jgi:hypothetical protein
VIKDFDDIRTNIRQKYMLDSNKIAVGSDVYFIFIIEEKYLDKGIKRGRIIGQTEKDYIVQSDSKYTIPKFLVFLNRFKAQEVSNKINIDELRFFI